MRSERQQHEIKIKPNNIFFFVFYFKIKQIQTTQFRRAPFKNLNISYKMKQKSGENVKRGKG